MHGQWFGELSGADGRGLAVLDLDDCEDGYRGSAFYFDQDRELPGTYARVVLPTKGDEHRIRAPLMALDHSGLKLTDEQMSRAFPNALHAAQAELHLRRDGDRLHVTFSTAEPTNTTGTGTLFRAPENGMSNIAADADINTWAKFRNHVGSMKPRKYIFRGQPCLNRLRTTFHRSNRSDLVRFVEDDIEHLHRAITPLARHIYDLEKPAEVGAFYSLLQHHGYPTPFLDWSFSPFISAFFAFRAKPSAATHHVRIFALDLEEWERASPRQNRLTFIPPHLSFTEFLNIENPRAGPQQAVSTATNLDDVEFFIRWVEKASGKTLLRAFDLPIVDRCTALDELSMMGITAASLFPGLDGTCETLKARMFGHSV